VQTAGVWSFRIDRATSGLGIQKLTISTGSAGQHENAVFKIEVFNEASFIQLFGDFFSVIVLSFKRIDQLQAHQIGHLDLDGHGAAIGSAGAAQTGLVTGPSVTTVNIDNGNR
jgi:hypothetical protein